jgi:outer membrane protein assembly factor BamD (BamD/ComL family)
LAEEVAALDAVRTASNIGAWNDAQRLLSKYHEKFPKGALGAEAEVLAIEALVGAGRTADARRSVQHFLMRRPNDPQATRVRSLVGASEAPLAEPRLDQP